MHLRTLLVDASIAALALSCSSLPIASPMRPIAPQVSSSQPTKERFAQIRKEQQKYAADVCQFLTPPYATLLDALNAREPIPATLDGLPFIDMPSTAFLAGAQFDWDKVQRAYGGCMPTTFVLVNTRPRPGLYFFFNQAEQDEWERLDTEADELSRRLSLSR